MTREEIEQLKNITQELFEKQYNSIKDLSNSELRKVIENSNWNFILQIIRYLENEIFILQEQNKTLNDQLDRELIKRARLEDRIKKAIEYVEQNKYVIREYTSANSGTKKVYELCCETDELLEILKGEVKITQEKDTKN